MTEQNSTDTPSSFLHIPKESTPLENSLIRRSPSNKSNVIAETPSPTMAITSPTLPTSSTASLAMYCTETDSVTQSIRHQQSITNTTLSSTATPIDESHAIIYSDRVQELVRLVEKGTALNDSDNDSFDDEDETITADAHYSSVSSITSNRIIMPCPICFESAALRSSSCCTFQCCMSCWCAHISSTINDGRIKITCISNECNKYLTREVIMNFIRYDPILQERYLKFYANANQNPRAKICPRCSHLYTIDETTPIALTNNSKKTKVKKNTKKIPKQVQCSECSLVWCFRCSAPWHGNMTCKQFLKGDKLLIKWINQKNEDQWNARKCPKCSSFIQRAGGCPHMTCSSCSCEFCYLCGRRYVKIPLIGQHNNKFSMFGCPYNLHPEKPWLRRTIRGMIATGVVVASPIIVVGAATAAVTVLPSIGIYRLFRYVRSHRHATQLNTNVTRQDILFDQDLEIYRELFPIDLVDEDMNAEIERYSPLHLERLNNDDAFPLSIFADMDVENLFSDNDKPSSDFRTCPTTPAINIRKGHSQSLDNLTTINHLTKNRHHSIILEH